MSRLITINYTLGRIPLEERSACSRHLYLTKVNTQKKRHSWPQRDSNQQCRQTSSLKLRPETARALESTICGGRSV